MTTKYKPNQTEPAAPFQLPAAELVQRELASAKSIDDFFGKEGIFARLFATTLEQMLEAEMDEHLGYKRYEAAGRNSGNSRNGRRPHKLRTSAGDSVIAVPRDRNSEFEPVILEKHATASNETLAKIINLYAKGVSTRDIADTLQELYGIEVSPTTISSITDKVWKLVEEWQSRPLAAIYPIIYLDAIHIKMRREGRVENVAVYNVLGVDSEGRRDILGHWLGEGGEGANFWLSVVTDLQARGVRDVLIACIDGLVGFKEAIHAVFPRTVIQRCVIHQVRYSLKYVNWKDRKAFVGDLKTIYQAATREEAETNLLTVAEKWGGKYALAIKSWEANWDELSTFFDYAPAIRHLIYTTNAVEGYHRQLRKVIKTKGAFPNGEAARKLLYLANQDITAKWTMPIQNWASILNQLAIRFESRLGV